MFVRHKTLADSINQVLIEEVKMKKTVVYAAALSAISVVAGLVAGAALERASIQKHLMSIRPPPPLAGEFKAQPKMGGPKEIFQRLAQDLNLNVEQKQEVKDILEKAREELTSIGQGSREKMLAIRKESNARILAILNPEQQERFKRIAAEAEKNHPRMVQRLREKFGEQPPDTRDLPPPPPPDEGNLPPEGPNE